jgi:hypothetical protein
MLFPSPESCEGGTYHQHGRCSGIEHKEGGDLYLKTCHAGGTYTPCHSLGVERTVQTKGFVSCLRCTCIAGAAHSLLRGTQPLQATLTLPAPQPQRAALILPRQSAAWLQATPQSTELGTSNLPKASSASTPTSNTPSKEQQAKPPSPLTLPHR